MDILSLGIIIIALMALAYNRSPIWVWVTTFFVMTITGVASRHIIDWPTWAKMTCGIFTLTLAFFAIKPLRRLFISDRLYGWFQKVLPAMSDTEREALEAGSVWWDAELFSGRPRWRKLLRTPPPSLSEEEQAFIDGPLEDLCRDLKDWEICDKHRKLPDDKWASIKSSGLLGMIIPKRYGGLEFSAQANSEVVMKLASRNLTAAVSVMVPNSLGPAELLLHYGTQAQKDHYLPRLANGDEIPCFALTSPSAGSDAAAMPDKGIVCKGIYNGEETLGLRVTWDKRYITLAPIATVIGLAFKAYDPEGLLGGKVDLGITCALIPADTPGVISGNRHMPVGAVFMNGPTQGEDVFVPMEWIIGGQKRIGHGWRMLMQSLAAGRAISLPALGTAGSKMSAMMTGAYARIRKQFKMPIAYFEGIEEPLARIGGRTYRMDAARKLTLVALDQGEKPSVLSAILKYQLTEGNRESINDAMDVHGGKGIIQGPNNYLAHAYQAIPIAITVEGANILTRSLIIFGQGAIRCHPYLLKEMQAAANPAAANAKRDFDRALFAHIGYTISNKVRAFVLGVTGARLTKAPIDGPTAHYYRQLTRMCAAFTFVADSVLLLLGGKFKMKEKLSGRLADCLIHLYLASATLKKFEDDGRPKEDLALVNWAVQDSLYSIQQSLYGVLKNFPLRWLGPLMRLIVFPLGRPYAKPSDYIGRRVARLLTSHNEARDRLISGVYISHQDDACGRVLKAFDLMLQTTDAERALKNAFKRAVSIDNYEVLADKGVDTGVITVEQANQIKLAQEATRIAIDVDDFSREHVEGYQEPAFRPAIAEAG